MPRSMFFLYSLPGSTAASSAWGMCTKQRKFQNLGLGQGEKLGTKGVGANWLEFAPLSTALPPGKSMRLKEVG